MYDLCEVLYTCKTSHEKKRSEKLPVVCMMLSSYVMLKLVRGHHRDHICHILRDEHDARCFIHQILSNCATIL